jgi:hypothetical protein
MIPDVPRAGVNDCQEKKSRRKKIFSALRIIAKASVSLQFKG